MKLPKELEQLNEKARIEIEDIYGKIFKYMAIVKKTVRDMVPKAIKLYIIDELIIFIENDLQPSLYHPVEKLVSSTETIEYIQISYDY